MQENNNASTHGLGRHMLIIGWIIGLGLLVLLFSDFLDHQFNPNQNVQTRLDSSGKGVVELLRNRHGHYVTQGHINGVPVIFMLDTGATLVSIPETIANKLDLERGPEHYASTANGTIKVYSTRLDRVGIGAIELHDIAADINPHMSSDAILLGMSFLKKLELTQRGDILTLRQY